MQWIGRNRLCGFHTVKLHEQKENFGNGAFKRVLRFSPCSICLQLVNKPNMQFHSQGHPLHEKALFKFSRELLSSDSAACRVQRVACSPLKLGTFRRISEDDIGVFPGDRFSWNCIPIFFLTKNWKRIISNDRYILPAKRYWLICFAENKIFKLFSIESSLFLNKKFLSFVWILFWAINPEDQWLHHNTVPLIKNSLSSAESAPESMTRDQVNTEAHTQVLDQLTVI